MKFCDSSDVRVVFQGKHVAIVGSGPGCLTNPAGKVDAHDVVVRVNNYRLLEPTGFRTDVHYSFYGASITKTAEELKKDGVTLCLCKCPDTKFMESEWHRKNKKPHGVDFRYIYQARKGWWFCDTYVPPIGDFLEVFNLLERHIPSTGFSALYEVLRHEPESLFLTGFDFFASKIHNVNERWQPGNPADPIGHKPEAERAWLIANNDRFPITMDASLQRATA